jgi:excisionase family DNA binding protein
MNDKNFCTEPSLSQLVGALRSDPISVRPAEACRRLGIGRTMLYRLMSEGKLPSVTIGRARLIIFEGLRRYVESAVPPRPQDPTRRPLLPVEDLPDVLARKIVAQALKGR